MSVTELEHGWSWEVPGAIVVITARSGGVSPAPLDSCNIGLHVGDEPANVLENRRRAAALLGLTVSSVAGVTQVHGADVWIDLAGGDELPADVRWDAGPSTVEADALVTTRREVALAVGVADCLPIAVVWGDAIAAIHAGWRSLEAGVIEATLRVLRRAAGPSIALEGAAPRALIGPAIGACCMEVGEEVATRFSDSSIVRGEPAGRPRLDTRRDAERRLEASGCTVEHVHVCTMEDPRCFSHRGDHGLGGRQALLIRRC